MKRFYEDKIVPIGQPSQRRWVSQPRACMGVLAVCGDWPHVPTGDGAACLGGGVPSMHVQGPAWRDLRSGTWVSVPTDRHSSWLLRLVLESSRGIRGGCTGLGTRGLIV